MVKSQRKKSTHNSKNTGGSYTQYDVSFEDEDSGLLK